MEFFIETVDERLLNLIMKEKQQTAIQELEMLGLLAAFKLFRRHLHDSKLALFSDSEAVRGAFASANMVGANAEPK